VRVRVRCRLGLGYEDFLRRLVDFRGALAVDRAVDFAFARVFALGAGFAEPAFNASICSRNAVGSQAECTRFLSPSGSSRPSATKTAVKKPGLFADLPRYNLANAMLVIEASTGQASIAAWISESDIHSPALKKPPPVFEITVKKNFSGIIGSDLIAQCRFAG
jgi:hypothetical protein